MMLTILGVLLVLYPKLSDALEVTLSWVETDIEDLCVYTLYQAERYGGGHSAWTPVKSIPKSVICVVVNVEDGKNFAWYLVASDHLGNELWSSNTVELCDKIISHRPVNFTKE